MKRCKSFGAISLPKIGLMLACLASFAPAETVHQTVAADKMQTGDGANAVAKGTLESKTIDGTEVVRLAGSVPQWGYVNCWFGLPGPEGKSVARFHVYVDGGKAAKTLIYVRGKNSQEMVGELLLPADAKDKTFVDIDLPVNSKEEWSGLVIKKAESSQTSGYWISSVSIVLAQ